MTHWPSIKKNVAHPFVSFDVCADSTALLSSDNYICLTYPIPHLFYRFQEFWKVLTICFHILYPAIWFFMSFIMLLHFLISLSVSPFVRYNLSGSLQDSLLTNTTAPPQARQNSSRRKRRGKRKKKKNEEKSARQKRNEKKKRKKKKKVQDSLLTNTTAPPQATQ